MGANQTIDWRRAAASTIEWWRDAGVDTLVEETPHNWLGSTDAPAAIVVEASAATVEALPDTLAAFAIWRMGTGAPDATWGTPIAPHGDPSAGLMVLIDMPEREDAATGQLLSGAAGALFDRMLAAIGRDRASIYLAALAVARPVSGRIPAEFLEDLSRLAHRHIALAAPKRLLLLGNAASRAVLGANEAPARSEFTCT